MQAKQNKIKRQMEAGAEEIDSDQEGQQDESEGEDFF